VLVAARLKRIWKPFDLHVIRPPFDGYNIEAYRLVAAMMNIHIVAGAMDNPGLFDSGNRFCGVPEMRVFAVSYLNKHQAVAILHNQVDFSPPAAKVPA
jgi:hypothetical protein